MTTTGVPANSPDGRTDTPPQEQSAQSGASVWVPSLPLDNPPYRAWQELVLAQAAEVAALVRWLSAGGWGATSGGDLDASIKGHLATAAEAAQKSSSRPWSTHGARMERSFAHLDAARTALMRRAPDAWIRGQLPGMVAFVRAHLAPSHPERMRVQEFAARRRPPGADPALTEEDRETLAGALQTASAAARREHARLRSFRNIVIATTVAMTVLAILIAAVGAARPSLLPLCFAPQGLDKVVCPTREAALPAGIGDPAAGGSADAEVAATAASTAQPADVAVVMLLGLAAAAVTGASALRRVRGTSTPFGVPVALLTLKLPTGALTAALGLLLLGGGVVPGLSALDSSGEILAWAVIFGAAQQLVTGVVDRQAQSVLESVGSTPRTDEQE